MYKQMGSLSGSAEQLSSAIENLSLENSIELETEVTAWVEDLGWLVEEYLDMFINGEVLEGDLDLIKGSIYEIYANSLVPFLETHETAPFEDINLYNECLHWRTYLERNFDEIVFPKEIRIDSIFTNSLNNLIKASDENLKQRLEYLQKIHVDKRTNRIKNSKLLVFKAINYSLLANVINMLQEVIFSKGDTNFATTAIFVLYLAGLTSTLTIRHLQIRELRNIEKIIKARQSIGSVLLHNFNPEAYEEDLHFNVLPEDVNVSVNTPYYY